MTGRSQTSTAQDGPNRVPLPGFVVDFLTEMRVPGVLSTLRPDGSPITSAVWYGVDAGDIIVSTPAARPKAHNVRTDPRVSFIVDVKEMPYRGVAIEGWAQVTDDPGQELAFAIAVRYVGPDLPDRIRNRTPGERVIVRITPERVRTWNFGNHE